MTDEFSHRLNFEDCQQGFDWLCKDGSGFAFRDEKLVYFENPMHIVEKEGNSIVRKLEFKGCQPGFDWLCRENNISLDNPIFEEFILEVPIFEVIIIKVFLKSIL